MTQLAYLWGEDAWAIDHAAAACATELADAGMPALATWRVSLDDDADDSGAGLVAKRRARLLDEVASRLGTATLFGDGTLVVLRQPGGLLRTIGLQAQEVASAIASAAPQVASTAAIDPLAVRR